MKLFDKIVIYISGCLSFVWGDSSNSLSADISITTIKHVNISITH